MTLLKQIGWRRDPDLFARKGDFRFAKIGEAKARGRLDDLKILRRFIPENPAIYPNIDCWFDGRGRPWPLNPQSELLGSRMRGRVQ